MEIKQHFFIKSTIFPLFFFAIFPVFFEEKETKDRPDSRARNGKSTI